MVKFNELRITEDNRIIIDVSILDLIYYQNRSIYRIVIDNQDTYKDGGYSNKGITVYSSSEGEEDKKQVRLELEWNNPIFTDEGGNFVMDITKDLLFVYVEEVGPLSDNTPSDLSNNNTLEVTINSCPIYNNIMQHIKEINSDCEIPKNFLDSYLRFKAMEISVASKHFMQAVAFYNKFFKKEILKVKTSKCRCNG